MLARLNHLKTIYYRVQVSSLSRKLLKCTAIHLELLNQLRHLLITLLKNEKRQGKLLCATPVALLQQMAAMAQQGYTITEMHSYGLSYEIIYEGLDYALANEYINDIIYAKSIDHFNNTVIVYTILIVGAVSAVGVGIYYLIKYLRSRPPSGSTSSEISLNSAPKGSSSTIEPSKDISQLIAVFPFKKHVLLLGSFILFILLLEITLLSC